MGLLAGQEVEHWEPFVLLGIERGLSTQLSGVTTVRERRRIIDRLRNDDSEKRALTVLAVLNFEAAENAGEVKAVEPAPGKPKFEGGRLLAILEWLANHKEFIQFIVSLFVGVSLTTPQVVAAPIGTK